MKTPALILSAWLLLGAYARAEDSPQVQLQLIERDLHEAFVTGRPPNPVLLDVPVLQNPGRFHAEERSKAESLIRLVRQVTSIQEGTDGSDPAKRVQLSNISQTALLFERSLRVTNGMPPEPVVKIYQDARRTAAAAAAAAIPDENRARAASLMNAGVFGPARDLGPTAGAVTAAPGAARTGELRAADFRPQPRPLDIKDVPSPRGPPSVAQVPSAAEQPGWFGRMTQGYTDFFDRWKAEGEKASAESPLHREGEALIAQGRRELEGKQPMSPEWREAQQKIRRGEDRITQANTVGGFQRHARFWMGLAPVAGAVDQVALAKQEGGVFNWTLAGAGLVPGVGPVLGVTKGVVKGAKGVVKGTTAAEKMAGKAIGEANKAAKAAGEAREAARVAQIAKDAQVGVETMRAAGVHVTPEIAGRVRGVEAVVGKLNSTYLEGYHALMHQVGKGSVGELGARMGLSELRKPAGMSDEAFNGLRAKFYMGGLVHDVETVTVFEQKSGARFIRQPDPTKINPIDIDKLGLPIETKVMKDGTVVKHYAKARDSQSNLATTLRTIKELKGLKAADDAVVELVALQTAFAPREVALLEKVREPLVARIRAQYGNDADEVLKMIAEYGKSLGVADVLNHYVRDPGSAFTALKNFVKVEYQNEKIANLHGSFGFQKFLSSKPEFVEGFVRLPKAEREGFVRNLVVFKIVQENQHLVADGVEEAVRIGRHPEISRLLEANKGWAELSFKDMLAAVDKLDSTALLAKVAR